MTNLDQVIGNFMAQTNTLGHRMQQANSYRDALAINEISQKEYQELLQDLQRFDDVQLNSDELYQQGTFIECLTMLSKLPL